MKYSWYDKRTTRYHAICLRLHICKADDVKCRITLQQQCEHEHCLIMEAARISSGVHRKQCRNTVFSDEFH